MKVESFTILILMVGFLFISTNLIIGDFSTNYNVTTSLTNSSKYTYYSQINNSISGLQSDIQAVGDTTGWKQVLVGASALWNGVISSAKMVLLSPLYLTGIISSASADMGLPTGVTGILLPIIIIMITITIIFVIMRFVRGDTSV